MDLQSFIQSGLLELYAMGQCSDKERTLVEQMTAQHASARTELDAIEQALEQYAFAQAIPPPHSLRDELLEALKSPAAAAPETAATPAAAGTSVRIFQALTGVLALASALLFWQFSTARSGNIRLQDQVAGLEKQLADCATQQRTSEKLRHQVVLLRDRDTKTFELSNGKSVGYVYHNTVRGETGLDLGGLESPQTGKYYQFWAIVGGTPVSMGMVEFRATGGWQDLPYLQNVAAFAISAETNPNGNATPTEVVMMGKLI